MDKKPLISFIIPVYNRENTLQRAIESILQSNFEDFEVILVDDCSTDKSLDLCKGYQKKDPRFKVIPLEVNKGPGHARNCGIKIAVGEWLYFVDSDDEICSEAILSVTNKLKIIHDDVDMIALKTVTVNENYAFDEDSYTADKEYEIEDFIKQYPEKLTSALWGFLYRRKFIVRYKICCPEFYSMEDLIFQLYSCLYTKKVFVFSELFYKYYAFREDSLAQKNCKDSSDTAVDIAMMQELAKVFLVSKKLNKLYQPFYQAIYRRVLTVGLRCNITYVPTSRDVCSVIEEFVNEADKERMKQLFEQLYCSFFETLLSEPVHIIPAGRLHRILAVQIQKNGGQVDGLYDNYIGSLEGVEMADAPGIKIYSAEKLKQMDKSIRFVSLVSTFFRITLRQQLSSYGYKEGLEG